MQAPIVRAFAEGEQAKRLLEVAKQHGINIREGEAENLLQILKSVPVNAEIPFELYNAVARIFAYFYMKQSQNDLEKK